MFVGRTGICKTPHTFFYFLFHTRRRDMVKLSRYDIRGEVEEKVGKRKRKVSGVPLPQARKQTPAANSAKPKSLSNRLRDTKRALAKLDKAGKSSSDAEKKSVLGEKLSKLTSQKERQNEEQLVKREIERMRKVKFLELKKVQRKLAKVDDSTERRELLVELEYNKNFPSEKPYIPLYSDKISEMQRADQEKLLAKARKRVNTKEEDRVEKEADSSDSEGEEDDDEVKDDFFE